MPLNTQVAASSSWTLPAIEAFLADTVVPCRLSCLHPAGFPHVTSLWFAFGDDALWFSMQRSSAVARWLARDGRCGFEIAPDQAPYRGVRGRGHAAVLSAQDAPVLEDLIERYLGDGHPRLARWLTSRAVHEVTVKLTPCWLTAWDYTARMATPR